MSSEFRSEAIVYRLDSRRIRHNIYYYKMYVCTRAKQQKEKRERARTRAQTHTRAPYVRYLITHCADLILIRLRHHVVFRGNK